MKLKRGTIGTVIASALAASLCCITPLLAILAGTASFASSFSWLEPFRPYFITSTVLILGYAWYTKLQSGPPNIDCDCEPDKKVGFWQSKRFLFIITLSATAMLAFPSYAHLLYPNSQESDIQIMDTDLRTIEFKIKGMTCSACEVHVDYQLRNLEGVVQTNTSYKNGNAIVVFDPLKVDINSLSKTINTTGYYTTANKELHNEAEY